MEVDFTTELDSDEIYDALSSSEKVNIHEFLRKEGYCKEEFIEEPYTKIRAGSLLYEDFQLALIKLEKAYLSITIEDLNIIQELSKKY